MYLEKVPPESGGFQPKSDLTNSSELPGVFQVPLFGVESRCRDRRRPAWEMVFFPNPPFHGAGDSVKAHLFLLSFSYPWNQRYLPALYGKDQPEDLVVCLKCLNYRLIFFEETVLTGHLIVIAGPFHCLSAGMPNNFRNLSELQGSQS